jgi:hypothetical protein
MTGSFDITPFEPERTGVKVRVKARVKVLAGVVETPGVRMWSG